MCQLEKQLVKSHLIPRAVYDYCRPPDDDPIIMTNEVVTFSSRQTKDYVLCMDCEDILNSDGETWVLPLLADMDGGFPLYDILTSRKADIGDGTISAYFAANNRDLRTEMLAHFGLGIFWKASVYSWTKKKREPRIELGPYQEPLRLYLRKEGPFPKEMALVAVVAPRPVTFASMGLPYRTSTKECHHFMFHVPGIQFNLYVGKEIPESQRKCCVVSSPGNPMLLCDLSDSMIRTAREQLATAHMAQRVVEYQNKLKT